MVPHLIPCVHQNGPLGHLAFFCPDQHTNMAVHKTRQTNKETDRRGGGKTIRTLFEVSVAKYNLKVFCYSLVHQEVLMSGRNSVTDSTANRSWAGFINGSLWTRVSNVAHHIQWTI